MSRQHSWIAAMGLIACMLPGCTFRDAAPSVLHLERPGGDDEARVTFGMREMVWQVQAEQPVVLGRDWHPRSHEDYAYLGDESYQPYHARWMRATPLADGRTWQVELGLVPALWPGPASRRPEPAPGELIWLRGETKLDPLRDEREIRFRFESVSMRFVENPDKRALLSGTVQAQRIEPSAFDALHASFEQRRPEVAAEADTAQLP